MEDCGTTLKTTLKTESPIVIALNRLGDEISNVQETTVKFEEILASVLSQPEKSTECDSPHSKGQTSLETKLFEMSERIMDINTNLRNIQNRIQL